MFAAVSGCASSSRSLKEVSTRVEGGSGYKIDFSKEGGDAQNALLNEPLTAERAVEIAFRNNPALKANLEGLGVSSAEIAQARLPRNPVIEGNILYPEHGDGEITEVTIEQNFLSLLLIPMRSQIAGVSYRQLEYRLSQEVMDFALEVKRAYFVVLAAEQRMKLRQAVFETTEAAAEFAKRQREAGNVNELFLQNEIAASLESKLARARAEAELNFERQHLSELLGFPDRRQDLKISGELPYIRTSEPALDDLKKAALKERLDLLAARKEVEIQRKNSFMGRLGILDEVDVGYKSEKELDGERAGGPQVRVGVPLFDLGRNAALGAAGRLKQSEYELAAIENKIRSEVITAHDRLFAARNSVVEYNDSIIPARAKIVEEMQKHQNFMLVGLYDLLAAKREEINAREEYIQSLKEYWTSRAELERATGRMLPAGESMKPKNTAEPNKNEHANH